MSKEQQAFNTLYTYLYSCHCHNGILDTSLTEISKALEDLEVYKRALTACVERYAKKCEEECKRNDEMKYFKRDKFKDMLLDQARKELSNDK